MIKKICVKSRAVANTNNKQQGIKTRVTIPKTLTPFQLYLLRKHKSQGTMQDYEFDLLQFHRFLKTDLNDRIRYMEKITRVEMNFYKDYLKQKFLNGEFAGSTVRRKFHSLKTYYNFLNEEYNINNLLKNDKFAEGFPDSSENIGDKIFSDEERIMFLKSLEEDKSKKIHRDKLMIYILLSIGCRKSEMLELRWKDISIIRKEIKIKRSKTKNYDVLPLKDEVIELFVHYTDSHGMESEFVFPSSRSINKPMSSSTFNQMFKRKIGNANLRDDLTPHSLRHTFITNCLRKGISGEKIIKYTGHASVSGLEPYTHFITEDLRDVFDAIDLSIGA